MSVKKPSQPADNYIKDERRRETLEKRGGEEEEEGARSLRSPGGQAWCVYTVCYTVCRTR